MQLDLTSLEVLEMAEWIESRAAKYYRILAGKTHIEGVRQALLNLARMEEQHEKTFSGFRSLWGSQKELQGSADYTGVIARMTLDVDSILADVLTEQVQVDDVISRAIEFEKSTMVFFVTLKGMMDDPADRQKIDRIIQEEVGHVLSLTGYLHPSSAANFQAAEGRYVDDQHAFRS